MRLAIAAAAALAGLCACAPGPTPGTILNLGDSGPPPIGCCATSGDAGQDAGTDAGIDAGIDAGTDAGCAALTLAGVPAVDGCHGNASTTATGTVNLANCTIDITVPGFLGPCSGSVSGASDAFDGGCGGAAFTCTSPSLPGNLTCTDSGGGVCAVKICDAGASCP